MSEAEVLDDIAVELQFDSDELLVLTLLRQMALGRDVVAERSPHIQQRKTGARNEIADAAAAAYWSRAHELPEWAQELATDLAGRVPSQQRPSVEAGVAEFGARITRRSRALLIMIDLYAFEPYPEGTTWVTKSRRRALDDAARALPALHPGDLDAVVAEYTAVLRRLGRKQVRWGRVAVASAVGLGLGVATMGMATPLIGAAIGGAAGLSGAAAGSAGLATLGGGSLAAGGFGMAGGTALLTGLGAVTGAGAGAAGSRIIRRTAGQVVADAVKLEVVTRLVVIGIEGDDEKARRVVEGLQARLDEVTVRIGALSAQIRSLAADNVRLSEENEQLRTRLQAEHDDAEMAGAALEIVIDRLPAGG